MLGKLHPALLVYSSMFYISRAAWMNWMNYWEDRELQTRMILVGKLFIGSCATAVAAAATAVAVLLSKRKGYQMHTWVKEYRCIIYCNGLHMQAMMAALIVSVSLEQTQRPTSNPLTLLRIKCQFFDEQDVCYLGSMKVLPYQSQNHQEPPNAKQYCSVSPTPEQDDICISMYLYMYMYICIYK